MKKTRIPFFMLCFLPMIANASIQISSIGLRLGQVMPSVTNEGVLSVGIYSTLENNSSEFMFRPFFDYWAAAYDKGDDNWNRQLFALGFSALKPFNLTNSKAVPFVGGGLGLTYNSWHIKFPHEPEHPSSKDFEFDLALNILGGIEVPFTSSLNGSLELKYTLAGVADYFGFWIGLSYQLNSNSVQQD